MREWRPAASAPSPRRGIVGDLGAMPNGDDPHVPPLDTIEETIRRHDHLPEREIGELGEGAPRVREPVQAAQMLLGSFAKVSRRGRIVPADVLQGTEKLLPRRGREAGHGSSSPARRASASAKTL